MKQTTNNQLDDKTIFYLVVFPIATVLGFIAVGFLAPWFASFSSIIKLFFTWLAFSYLWECAKFIVDAIDKAISTDDDEKINITIKSAKQPTKRGKKKDNDK